MSRCVRGTGALLRRRRTGDRGAAAVEFALILFPLMLIVFGIINYGDMLSVRQSVSQAASEGARAAAVELDPAKRDVSAQNAVNAALATQGSQYHCVSWGTGANDCSVSVAACSNDATKSCATVKVVIPYHGMIPGFGLVLPDWLRYTAVARVS
jgi:Flp pilus assembly protein TadG